MASGAYESAISLSFGDGSPLDGFFGGAFDLNQDGRLDLIGTEFGGGAGSGLIVYLGNGNGTFQGAVTYSTGTGPIPLRRPSDFNHDGIADLGVVNTADGEVAIYLGNGDGTFKDAITTSLDFITSGANAIDDLDGDGNIDIVVADDNSASVRVLLGNGDGTFRVSSTSNATGNGASDLYLVDFNIDGRLDLALANYDDGNGTSVNIYLGAGDGTFGTPLSLSTGMGPNAAVGDIDRNGTVDIVTVNVDGTAGAFLGNGDGSFTAHSSPTISAGLNGATLQDINGDGLLDLLSADYTNSRIVTLLGNGDGTFKAVSSYASGNGSALATAADINNDGALDLVSLDLFSTGSFLLANPVEVTTLPFLNLASRSGALEAMNTVDGALARISSGLGAIGSTQSRLQVASANLLTARENYLAAESRIISADVAQESAALVRGQILQEVAAAVLAQANQEPRLALKLLQG